MNTITEPHSGQILDPSIYPPVDMEHGGKAYARIGVLIVEPDAKTICVVNSRLSSRSNPQPAGGSVPPPAVYAT